MTSRPWWRAGRDEGSGTVLALALVALLAGLLIAVAGLGSAVVARHRADSAADLGALAAADRSLGRAPGDPCTAAARVVRADGAALTACAVSADASVVVGVRVQLPPPWSRLGAAVARSRAGPADVLQVGR